MSAAITFITSIFSAIAGYLPSLSGPVGTFFKAWGGYLGKQFWDSFTALITSKLAWLAVGTLMFFSYSFGHHVGGKPLKAANLHVSTLQATLNMKGVELDEANQKFGTAQRQIAELQDALDGLRKGDGAPAPALKKKVVTKPKPQPASTGTSLFGGIFGKN